MICIKQGYGRMEAAIRTVTHTRWPLLGATVIAITAFAPIGLSPDASGEFTGSLFWVLLISLFLSWVLAVSLTPFFCYLLLGGNDQNETDSGNDPYRGVAYHAYRALLLVTLRFRWLTIGLMTIALILSVYGFGYVKQAFFPASSLPMFMVEYWLPEGSDIRAVSADIESIEQEVLVIDGVESVTATIGRGAERFVLTYSPELSNSSYAQMIIRTNHYEQIEGTVNRVQALLYEEYPQAFTKVQRFELGPGSKAKIEARLIGPDPMVLRTLSKQVIAIFD
jgi:multidrug efflux pump subunit AcrB